MIGVSIQFTTLREESKPDQCYFTVQIIGKLLLSAVCSVIQQS